MLPRELVFLYLAAPFFLTPIVEGEFFSRTPGEMLLALALNASVFLVIPPAIHALYHFVMPRVLARLGSRAARVVAHAVLSGLVAFVGGAVALGIIDLLVDEGPDAAGFLFRCVVLTWGVVLPALVLQGARQARQAALRAQLEALQARTQPHFLFNAMNTVASLIEDDPKLAERTVERLSDVLRYALRGAKDGDVALGEELAMVRAYLEIQRARFGERLRFVLDVEPGLEDARVPALIVQPLVENAVLHGLEGRTEGGTITVTARRDGDRLEIAVEDDGPGPGASTRSGGHGIGLADVARRVELLHGAAGTLRTRAAARGGFHVALALPLRGAGT